MCLNSRCALGDYFNMRIGPPCGPERHTKPEIFFQIPPEIQKELERTFGVKRKSPSKEQKA